MLIHESKYSMTVQFIQEWGIFLRYNPALARLQDPDLNSEVRRVAKMGQHPSDLVEKPDAHHRGIESSSLIGIETAIIPCVWRFRIAWRHIVVCELIAPTNERFKSMHEPLSIRCVIYR